MILRTPRLTLRPPAEADVAAISAASSDLRVARMVSRIPYPNPPESVRAFFASAADLPVFVIDDGAPVGMCGIEGGEVGYWLAPAVWGRGYMTEAATALVAHAVDALGIVPLAARVFDDNPASTRVLAKLGFRPVGRSRALSLGRGEEVAQTDLALTAADWRVHSGASGSAAEARPAARRSTS